MVYDGNRDWVSANGNREVANVVMTNFNQPQGNPEMGQFSIKSSGRLLLVHLSDSICSWTVMIYYRTVLHHLPRKLFRSTTTTRNRDVYYKLETKTL